MVVYRCVCSEKKSYGTLFLTHHLLVCEESIRKGVCCIFSLMEYYLAILQISGEKVLQPRLTLKLITADSRSSQQQRTKCNANGCAKDCRKRPCCCLSCNIGLRAHTCELPLPREAVHCSWRRGLMAKIPSAPCFSGPPSMVLPLSLSFGLCGCS